MAEKRLQVLIISGLPLFPLMNARGGYRGPYLGAKSFVDSGHCVYFLTCRPAIYYAASNTKRPLNYVEDGINIVEFTVPFLNILKKTRSQKYSAIKIVHYSQYLVQLIAEYLILFLFTLFAIRSGLSVAKKIKPNVVYAYNEIAALAAWLIAKRCRVPNVTRLFGTFLNAVSQTKFYKLRYLANYLGYKVSSNYLIVLNDGTKGDEIAGRLKIPESRFKFWRDGINPGLYDPSIEADKVKKAYGIPSENKIILAVNRLAKIKGIDRIINAAPTVIQEEKGVIFVIIGDGPEKGRLMALADELKVTRWVKFLGEFSPEQVKLFMNIADIYMSMHDISQWSNSTIEAMSTGRCLVALDDGSLNDLLKNEENGFLVKPGDNLGLAKILVYLLRNDEIRKRSGSSLRNRVLSTFQTWDQRNRMEVRLIEDLVAKKALEKTEVKGAYDFR